jgi:hypothetical protein
MLSPRRAGSRSLAELPGEVSGVGLVMLAAPACGTGGCCRRRTGGMGCRVIPPCLPLETNRRHPLSLAGGGTITACQQREGLSSLTPTSVPPRCGTVTTTPGPSTKCCANGSTPARAPEQMAVPGVVRCWRLRVYDLLPIAPRRTRSRGHRAAAAPWRPWAILEHPTPKAAFAASPQERSLKLTPAPLGGPGTGRASDQAAPVPICQAAVHSRGRWCPGWPTPDVRDTRQPTAAAGSRAEAGELQCGRRPGPGRRRRAGRVRRIRPRARFARCGQSACLRRPLRRKAGVG